MKSRFGLGRNMKQIWDNLYLIFSVLVIITSILVLILVRTQKWVFPVCFFTAAFMQVFRGSSLVCRDDKHKRDIMWAVIVYLTAIGLFVLGLISTGIFG